MVASAVDSGVYTNLAALNTSTDVTDYRFNKICDNISHLQCYTTWMGKKDKFYERDLNRWEEIEKLNRIENI